MNGNHWKTVEILAMSNHGHPRQINRNQWQSLGIIFPKKIETHWKFETTWRIRSDIHIPKSLVWQIFISPWRSCLNKTYIYIQVLSGIDFFDLIHTFNWKNQPKAQNKYTQSKLHIWNSIKQHPLQLLKKFRTILSTVHWPPNQTHKQSSSWCGNRLYPPMYASSSV